MVALQLTPSAGPLPTMPELVRRVEELGYEALWMGEVNRVDVIVPATIAAMNSRRLSIGALFNVFTRAPTNAAIAASGLSHLAPGRVNVVLGASSPLLVGRWNGIPYQRPYARVRDYLAFLRVALTGERVRGEYTTFTSSGFTLDNPPEVEPRLLVAAAMPRTIDLALNSADGLVLNWVSPRDLDRLIGLDRLDDAGRIWLSVTVCPSPDREVVDRIARPLMSDYLAVPAYAGLQQAVGRGDALRALWELTAADDRAGARAALPAEVIDELVIYGTAAQCGQHIRKIEAEYGIHVIATVYLPEGAGYDETVRAMASHRVT